MAFKVNYNQQRAERDRAKAAKNEAKQREKEEETARRKAEREIPTSATDASSSEEKRDGDPKRRIETAFVMFDVLYLDGTRTPIAGCQQPPSPASKATRRLKPSLRRRIAKSVSPPVGRARTSNRCHARQ